MKKFINFLVVVFDICLVVVPIILLAGGLYLGTGPAWDVLMIAGICTILAFAYNKFHCVQKGKERAEQARFMIAMIGVLVSFLPLATQAIYCRVNAYGIWACEGAMVWLFFLMTVELIDMLREEKPSNGFLTWTMALSVCWLSICALGGIFDLFEYFFEMELPKRLGDLLGVLSPVTGIGTLVFGLFGILKEHTSR
ncbi:MAG: hypothetical protein IJ218_03280 [Alphaproteobacteria bacterium]|nr:hypothetical protein [Alphaproteobacteria bacterium]